MAHQSRFDARNRPFPTKVEHDSRRGLFLNWVDQGWFISGERTNVALKLETDVGRRGEPGFGSNEPGSVSGLSRRHILAMSESGVDGNADGGAYNLGLSLKHGVHDVCVC